MIEKYKIYSLILFKITKKKTYTKNTAETYRNFEDDSLDIDDKCDLLGSLLVIFFDIIEFILLKYFL
jgi:hypothetical protein